MSKYIDLQNKKFSKLLVISLVESPFSNRREVYWKCLCDCGEYCITNYNKLTTKKTTACKKCTSRNRGDRQTKLLKGESGLNKLYRTYKSHALARNYEFELTKEQFKNITILNCHYCNIEPNQKVYSDCKGMSEKGIEYSTHIYNGIDRKDNSLGYILENCLPCCKICNRAKSNMKYEDFLNWLMRIKGN